MRTERCISIISSLFDVIKELSTAPVADPLIDSSAIIKKYRQELVGRVAFTKQIAESKKTRARASSSPIIPCSGSSSNYEDDTTQFITNFRNGQSQP